MKLEGKVAIVTGASSGMGRETAICFAKDGARVTLVGRNTKRLGEVEEQIKSAGGSCITVSVDLTKLPGINKVVEQTMSEFGRVDILVNAAGIFPLGEFLTNSEVQYDHTMATNVKSQFFLSQRVAQEMKKQNKGKIINFSSVAGKIGFATAVLYCSSKAAILGMTKAMALELAPYNIRVNALVPGNIRTPMNEELLKNKDYEDFMISKTPLKYIDGPTGITQLILFLASDDSDYATGADFVFDGGVTAGISV